MDKCSSKTTHWYNARIRWRSLGASPDTATDSWPGPNSIETTIVSDLHFAANLMKLCTVVCRGWKTEIEFVRDQNRITPSLILPQFPQIFTNSNAFSMGRSKHCSIDACWSIVVVNTSQHAPRRPLGALPKNDLTLNVPQTPQIVSSAFTMRIMLI